MNGHAPVHQTHAPTGIEAVLLQVVVAAPQLAILAVMAGGFALMFGKRNWMARLLLLAVLFAVVGVYGPSWLPSVGGAP